MPEPPSGTVTFLFTDIEGSTRRWEQYPDAMRAALARHDTILRSSIEVNSGYVFKTVGDAFYASFGTALHALSAAITSQIALQGESWSEEIGSLNVRIAIHTGIADFQDGDYFGQPLNRVSRILSTGHGGQTLLSEVTYGLVRDTLPDGVSAIDMGEHRLKDLTRPERIYQLVVPDLPPDFPALRSLDSRPNNLPLQTTALIGREKELDHLSNLLARNDVRLVTLTGPGGTGKTRLALQAAAGQIEAFDDGVFFVPLAPVTDPDLVLSVIAHTLGVRETGRQALLESVKFYLRDKRLLLILDNFEQVTPASAVITELLTTAPGLKVLVTSRNLLHLSGEFDFPVPTLTLPNIKRLPTLEQLTQYEAVRLFIDRAVALKPDFEVNNQNAPAVAEICYRLDGLPLAIELAAARIRLLPPQAMLSRLANRLKLLTGGAVDRPSRQQTLRGAIEWSHDLLTASERILFRRLSVFVGGSTLEAIEAVCGGADAELDALDGTQSLIDKSLLKQEETQVGEPRFTMLETIREYAQERLAQSGEQDAVQREHALYYVTLAEEAEPELRGPHQVEWLERLEMEHDNFRASLRWAGEGGSERDETEIALRLAAALGRFWFAHGHLSEGRRELEAALASAKSKVQGSKFQDDPNFEPETLNLELTRARALYMAGRLAMIQGDVTSARPLYEESRDLFTKAGDRQGLANAVNDLGNVSGLQGDYVTKRALHEQSLAIFRKIGDRSGIAGSLLQLGNLLLVEGDHAAARAHVEESMAMLRQLGDVRGIAMSLFFLGNTDLDLGDYAAARNRYDEGLKLFREIGDKWTEATLLVNMGNAVCAQGDLQSAEQLFEESLETFRVLGARQGMADALTGLASIAQQQGRYDQATSLFQESLAIYKELGTKLSIIESFERLAQVASRRGQVQLAAQLYSAADAHRQAIKSPLPPSEQAEYSDGLTHARSQADAAEWDDLWQSGQAMSLDEAADIALHMA
jgi:predicted ATPase/class 3 adenylate cyclase/Tfp pilus assembly protein PilF